MYLFWNYNSDTSETTCIELKTLHIALIPMLFLRVYHCLVNNQSSLTHL